MARNFPSKPLAYGTLLFSSTNVTTAAYVNVPLTIQQVSTVNPAESCNTARVSETSGNAFILAIGPSAGAAIGQVIVPANSNIEIPFTADLASLLWIKSLDATASAGRFSVSLFN
jgi:hypothetical protein